MLNPVVTLDLMSFSEQLAKTSESPKALKLLQLQSKCFCHCRGIKNIPFSERAKLPLRLIHVIDLVTHSSSVSVKVIVSSEPLFPVFFPRLPVTDLQISNSKLTQTWCSLIPANGFTRPDFGRHAAVFTVDMQRDLNRLTAQPILSKNENAFLMWYLWIMNAVNAFALNCAL